MVASPRRRWRSLAIGTAPVAAAAVALLAHHYIPNRQTDAPTHIYPLLLKWAAAASLLLSLLQMAVPWLAHWMRPKAPIWGAALMLVCAWDLISLKFALLPLPHFPGPDMVFQALVDDWRMLAEAAARSLGLLAAGYAIGVVLGLISGVAVGWSAAARYWAMPLIKFLGPIPATAWIPLAMILSDSSFRSGAGLIALTVWFPVTMLTSSGVAAVRQSHLDVARTLGAGRAYLIFRVAVPSAMPSIFVGLFMGLVSSFLTLVVAEMLGVKSGLGWYVQWKRDWAEYAHVYAALIITAIFCSTLLSVLFRLRDRLLVWQKGVIKW